MSDRNTLTLTNFRHHGSYQLELTPECIHLISGDSGAGKSTLFQAILWVLYGKMKKVTPRDCPTGTRAIVILRLEGRVITRKSNTDEFSVELENNILKGEAASGYIESWLGNKDFWISTSYLMQKKPSAFLMASPVGKLEILNNIIFMVQNPGVVIDKADIKLESIRRQKEDLQKSYDRLVNSYKEVCVRYNITEKEIFKGIPTEIEGIEVSKVSDHFTLKQEELEQVKKEMVIVESKLARIDELENKLKGIPNIQDMEREAKEAIDASRLNDIRRRDLDTKSRLEEKVHIYETKLKSFGVYPGYPEQEYSISDIELTRIKERQVEMMKSRFSEHDIKYTQESLSSSISSLKDQLEQVHIKVREHQDYIHNLSRWSETQEELKVLNSKLSEIEELEAKLEGISEGLLDSMEAESRKAIEGHRVKESRSKDIELRKRLQEDIDTYKEYLETHNYHPDVSNIKYTREQIECQRKKEVELRYSQESFSKLGVEYNKRSLDNEISSNNAKLKKLRESLAVYEEYLNDLETWNKSQLEITNLSAKMEELKGKIITPVIERNTLEQKISEARRIGEDRISEIDRVIDKPFITCPHCDNHVYWSGNSLVKTKYYDREALTKERNSILEERNRAIVELEEQLSKAKEIEEYNWHVNSIISQITSKIEYYRSCEKPQEVPAVNKVDIETCILRMSQLCSLRFVENLDISSDAMEKSNDNWEYTRFKEALNRTTEKLNGLIVLPDIEVTMSIEQAYDNLDYVSRYRSDLSRLKYMNKESVVFKIEKLKAVEMPVFDGNFDPSIIDRLRSKLSLLYSLEYIDQPNPSSEYMERSTSNYNRRVTQDNFDKIKKELNELNIQPEVVVSISKEQGYRNLEIVSEYKNYQNTLIELKKEELKIHDIESMKSYLLRLEEGYKRYQLMCWVIPELNKIKGVHDELNRLQYTEMGIARVKEMMIALEYSMYIEATNKINMYLDEYISELFVEPIRVKLLMFKTLKDKGRIKPSVNIQATCEGVEFDISSLSGGEDERLSLAITLALNKLSKSPFLILDETFGSLSDNDRERALKVLSKHGKKKNTFTLCVNHGSVEGFYDKETYIAKKS